MATRMIAGHIGTDKATPLSPLLARDQMLKGWRQEFREFRRKHGAKLSASESELIHGLLNEHRASKLEQWMKGLEIVGRVSKSARCVRRFVSGVTAPVLEIRARNTGAFCLPSAARDEFMAGHAADAAQFPVIERYADCSVGQLQTALHASEQQIVALEMYCDALRAALVERQREGMRA